MPLYNRAGASIDPGKLSVFNMRRRLMRGQSRAKSLPLGIQNRIILIRMPSMSCLSSALSCF